MTSIIRVSSAEIQAVFATRARHRQIGVGVRLVILEGLSGVETLAHPRACSYRMDGRLDQSRLTIFVKIRSVPKATSVQLIVWHLKPQSIWRSFPC